MRALLTAVLVLAAGQQPAMIAADSAAKHVGEEVVVQGIVTSVHTSEHDSTTFLDFGPKFPGQTFTAVIRSAARSRFTGVEKLVGSAVLVKGTITLYKGKPQIVLKTADQLRVVS